MLNVKELIDKFDMLKKYDEESRTKTKLRQQMADERRMKKREIKMRGKGDPYNPLHIVKCIVGLKHSKIDGSLLFKV